MTPEVAGLVKDSGFPGMKVLEFAFDSREPSDYLPHNYTPNCVCYVGTHDNETAMQWFKKIFPRGRALRAALSRLNSAEGINWGLIRGGMSSVAELFVAQMSDFLGLGAEARINEPGSTGNNWRWRLLPGQLDKKLCDRIYEYTKMYGRRTRPAAGRRRKRRNKRGPKRSGEIRALFSRPGAEFPPPGRRLSGEFTPNALKCSQISAIIHACKTHTGIERTGYSC